MALPAADAIIDQYQRIYHACHRRHVRDAHTGRLVSEQQLHILGHLDLERRTRVGELAAHMGLSHSTISIAIERLRRDGYVVRERSHADARVTFVRLTRAGEEVRDAQRVLEPDLVSSLLKRLAPDERRTARDGIALLARAASEEIGARRHAPRAQHNAQHGAA